MQVSSVGWRADLMARSLAGSVIDQHSDHLVVRTPHNPSFFWGNFVLAGADHGNVERWLSTFSEAFPAARHLAIGLDACEATPELRDSYAVAGLEAELIQVLTTASIVAPGNSGRAEYRQVASEDDWAQVLALRLVINGDEVINADEDAAGWRDFTRKHLAETRILADHGHAAWWGAFESGTLRASLGVLSDGSLASISAVETHPQARRQGFARQLLAHAGLHALKTAETLVIGADPDYHAIELYRALGFVDADTQIQLQKAGY